MLSNSPGALNWETAPFKLTREFVDVMGGEKQDLFQLYFKYLFKSGFLATRKYYKRIVYLVEMMLPGSTMGCFYKGPATIEALKDRFQLQLTTDEAMEYADRLVMESINNWKTGTYDSFQYLSNGIL
eukprot:TRINITY_DN4491_c0_g2_i2.p1 TRINITY_DN4491_c0_g2~~TRINITY_DN4491_c0_g2_i2.p1  ORF type:complete len:127 (-),score=16.87 TRINITY_DN4491_c0_g2_i2:21-401(-)